MSPIQIKFGIPTNEDEMKIHLPGYGLGSGLESVGLYPNQVRNINNYPVIKKLILHCNETFKNAN